ncbi:MAG: biotin/lipoyl-binding protein [Chloroflexi bacterium]|nr:biotin/lipoyl-binding protein [Chloroflexota bacterium]
MNVKRLLIGLLAVVVLAGGGFWAYRQFVVPEPEEEETAVDVDTVSVDTGVDMVSAEGQIVPLRDASLSFQVPGQVAAILVDEGNQIEAGDPLVQLDTADQEIALQRARAGLTQAQANLETTQAGMLGAQTAVAAAQVGVSAAEANLALAQAAASVEQIAVSEAGVDVAAAGVTQAAGGQAVTLEGAAAAQIRAAEAQLRAAQAGLKPVQDAYGQLIAAEIEGEAREVMELQFNAAIAQVNAAQAALDELNAGATEAERREAGGGVAAAAAQRDAAQAQLDLMLAGTRSEQITVAETGVAQAQAAVAEAELGLAQAETAVTQAEAGITQAETAVATAQEALDRMTLTAPFAGIVGDIAVELGELVAPGVPAVILADFSGWQIKTTDLTELDVVAVEIGLPIEATVDALPGETLHGTVSDIAAAASIVRGDVTYVVTIDLEERPDLPLRWGMTVFVNVDVSQ